METPMGQKEMSSILLFTLFMKMMVIIFSMFLFLKIFISYLTK